MITINLIPDAKAELLAINHRRRLFIHVAIGSIVVSLVVLMALSLWVFVWQSVEASRKDNDITTLSSEVGSIKDVNSLVTIQQQLTRISDAHKTKNVYSRVFDFLAATTGTQSSQSAITISSLTVDAAERTVAIDGAATGGSFARVEAFKKTIEHSVVTFGPQDNRQSKPLVDGGVAVGETGLAQDGTGARIARFTMTFRYADEAFSKGEGVTVITGPNRINVTDSYTGLPQSLFSTDGQAPNKTGDTR